MTPAKSVKMDWELFFRKLIEKIQNKDNSVVLPDWWDDCHTGILMMYFGLDRGGVSWHPKNIAHNFRLEERVILNRVYRMKRFAKREFIN